MITINDLKIIAQKNTSDSNEDATLFIDDEKALEIDVKCLFKYFGEDDKHRVIRLVVQDREVGYIRREDLYDFIAIAEKGAYGLSDSFGFETAGDGYSIHYKCPAGDKDYWVTGGSGIVIIPKCEFHHVDMIEVEQTSRDTTTRFFY